MANTSPFLVMQETERQIKSLLRSVDAELLEPAEKKAVASLRRLAVDTRLDIRDYELSETREEQLQCVLKAKKRLNKLEKAVLDAGPMVFGAADVAQISAQLEQIHSRVI